MAVPGTPLRAPRLGASPVTQAKAPVSAAGWAGTGEGVPSRDPWVPLRPCATRSQKPARRVASRKARRSRKAGARAGPAPGPPPRPARPSAGLRPRPGPGPGSRGPPRPGPQPPLIAERAPQASAPPEPWACVSVKPASLSEMSRKFVVSRPRKSRTQTLQRVG
ncbi:protein C19orf12 homolog isoform X2 [Papio anubis]|uniref:protein C19orf12 homolog isoform X2 n=1 Tax=Papio anubis TaxID=9555 RepID=UPI0012ADEFB4|nr:protein C19orf12 homolog isoform X2 [Papio anubis]